MNFGDFDFELGLQFTQNDANKNESIFDIMSDDGISDQDLFNAALQFSQKQWLS